MARGSAYFASLASVVLVLAPAAAHPMSSSTSPNALIVVKQRGWSEQFRGRYDASYSWGVVLANRSRSLDALSVVVFVDVIATNGDEIDQLSPTFRVIPAGQTFYVGNETGNTFGEHIRSIRVSIRVGSTQAKKYVLPRVSDLRVNRGVGTISGVMTNPYNRSISNSDLTSYLVVYDRKGRVIGGNGLGVIGSFDTVTIKAGAHTRISFLIPDGVSPARIASARVSVGFL